MKILSSKAIRTVDAKTIEYNGIESHELMESAASAFADYFIEHYFIDERVAVFSGTGNNGGDGVAVGRMLHWAGNAVKLYIVEMGSSYSKDCLLNIERAQIAGVEVIKIESIDETPSLKDIDVVIDALFGTGLSRPLSGLAKDMIERINSLHKTVISIDIPSGLFMDRLTEVAIHATETVTFQIPKLALFLPSNNKFVGSLSTVDIGLDAKAIAEADTDSYYLTNEGMAALLNPLDKFTHKGLQGHALIAGGSLGKIGAVALASKAALRSGCGLVTAFTPKCGVIPIQSTFPEAMVVQDHLHTHISAISYSIEPSAIAIGMGMGQHRDTQDALRVFLKGCTTPLVVDADALNILSKNPDWLKYLPPATIITPHPKELARLIGEWGDDFDKIELSRLFARKYNLIVVIKGAHTLIVDANNIYVNSSGTPALATAGSGDVLSGILAGLLAQGYKPIVATQLGVYIHGMTANITAKEINPRSFIASDIINNMGKVYDRMSTR